MKLSMRRQQCKENQAGKGERTAQPQGKSDRSGIKFYSAEGKWAWAWGPLSLFCAPVGDH